MVDSAAAMEAAVSEHDPELIVCPFLKKMIPESIWVRASLPDRAPGTARRPWTVLAGLGDRARVREWGVTVLEANGEFDAGEVWATRTLPDAARRERAACTATRCDGPRSRR